MSNLAKLPSIQATGLNVRDRNEENRVRLRALIKGDPTGAMARSMNVDQHVVIMGLRDRDSIAYHVGVELLARGAYVAFTYWLERTPGTAQTIAEEMGADWCEPCNVECDEEIFALFNSIPGREGWGDVRISVLHSIAFANKLAMQPIIYAPTKDALMAISVSAMSFGRVIQAAEPLMGRGSTAMALGYSGAERLEDGYDGAIGLAKNMIDFIMKSAAKTLGPKGIRVVCISPGPMDTAAAHGLSTFGTMHGRFLMQSPMHTDVEGRHVAGVIANHMAPASALVSGQNLLIDGARSVVA